MSGRPHEAWVERAARLYPQRTAIDDGARVLSFRDLAAASSAVAGYLEREGAVPGDRVAITCAPGSDFAVALHASLITGTVAVPIDSRLPEVQRRERLATASVTLDGSTVDGVAAGALAGGRGSRTSVAPARRTLAGTGADHATPAVQLTTSGTTGPGTPVLLSRGALLWNALGSAAALGQPPHERWLSSLPVSHVGGLTVLARSAIVGTCAVLRPRFEISEQVALLQAGQATIISVVPTMLGRLLDAGLSHPPALRLVLLGGAPIPGHLVERAAAAGVAVAGTYGLTEACSQVLTNGAPLFCTDVALRGEVDPAAPASGADELLVRGPTLAAGVAAANGWLYTGDRARRTGGSRFEIVGRISETIVTGGENVAPSEVEAALCALPGISDAAVLGVADGEWGERVEARVVLAPGSTLDRVQVREALRGTLAAFAIPKRIEAVDALPRTTTGKLIRRELG